MENIIFQKQYNVETGVPINNSFALMGNERITGLTDDRLPASLDYHDEAWTRFYRGLYRNVTVDLEGEFAVTGFEITFLHDKSAGIYSPQRVDILVSEDGVGFMPAYSVDSTVTPSNSEKKLSVFRITDGARYKAKFIRLVFGTDVNVFTYGFKVFGEECNGAELPVIPVENVDTKAGMRAREDGYASTCIIYHGYWDNTMNYGEHYVKNTVQMLLPYVGHLNDKGEITDTMFDSIVFLLLQSRSPSGGKAVFYGCDEKNATVKGDYEVYAENLFLDEYNMGALETAFGMVKEKLGLPDDRKLNVSVQIPYVYKTKRPFGDINGDGVDEGSETLEERLAIYEYYIDKIIADFNAKNYKNLNLAAFYQGCEGVPVAMSDEEFKLFAGANAIIHSRGLKATWIPCFLGTGFEKWKELGFDFAYLQPNYMFHDFNPEALDDFAWILEKYGLGAEIEINYTAVSPDHERFEHDKQKYVDYLDYGYKTGFINSALAFYQGAGPGSYYRAAMSKDERARDVYERTYRFIKGCYAPDEIKEEEKIMDDTNIEALESVAEETENVAAERSGIAEKAAEQVKEAANQVKQTALKTAASAKELAGKVKTSASTAAVKAAEKTRDMRAKATEKTRDARVKAAEQVKKGKEIVTEKAKTIPEDKALAALGAFGAVVALIGAICGGDEK